MMFFELKTQKIRNPKMYGLILSLLIIIVVFFCLSLYFLIFIIFFSIRDILLFIGTAFMYIFFCCNKKWLQSIDCFFLTISSIFSSFLEGIRRLRKIYKRSLTKINDK
nr:hypothetical protein [Trebouxia sp. A1-2]